jgi:hypothetical protein
MKILTGRKGGNQSSMGGEKREHRKWVIIMYSQDITDAHSQKNKK